MTIAMLLRNTLDGAKQASQKKNDSGEDVLEQEKPVTNS